MKSIFLSISVNLSLASGNTLVLTCRPEASAQECQQFWCKLKDFIGGYSAILAIDESYTLNCDNATTTVSPTQECQQPGRICYSSDLNNYHSCLPGHYCEFGELNECKPGTFQAETGASECLLCPEGTYCPESKTIEPIPCPAGYYCLEGTHNAFECPDGNDSPVGSKEIKDCYFYSIDKTTTVEIATGYASGSGAETVMPASTPISSTSSTDMQYTTMVTTSQIPVPDDLGSSSSGDQSGNHDGYETVVTTDFVPVTTVMVNMKQENTTLELITTEEVTTDSTAIIQDETLGTTGHTSTLENMSGSHATMVTPSQTPFIEDVEDSEESSESEKGETENSGAHTSSPSQTTALDDISASASGSEDMGQTTVNPSTVLMTDSNSETTIPVVTMTEKIYPSTEFSENYEKTSISNGFNQLTPEISDDSGDSSGSEDVTVRTTEFLQTTVATNQPREITTETINTSGDEPTVIIQEVTTTSAPSSSSRAETTDMNNRENEDSSATSGSESVSGSGSLSASTEGVTDEPSYHTMTTIAISETTVDTTTVSGFVNWTTEPGFLVKTDDFVVVEETTSQSTETTESLSPTVLDLSEPEYSGSETPIYSSTVATMSENDATTAEMNDTTQTSGFESEKTSVTDQPQKEISITTNSDISSGVNDLTTVISDFSKTLDGTTVTQLMDTTHIESSNRIETTTGEDDIGEFTVVTTPPPPPFPVTSLPIGSGTESGEISYSTAGAPNRPLELTTVIDDTGSGEITEITTFSSEIGTVTSLQSLASTTNDIFVGEQTTDAEIFTFPSSTIFESEITTVQKHPGSITITTDFVQVSSSTQSSLEEDTTQSNMESSSDISSIDNMTKTTTMMTDAEITTHSPSSSENDMTQSTSGSSGDIGSTESIAEATTMMTDAKTTTNSPLPMSSSTGIVSTSTIETVPTQPITSTVTVNMRIESEFKPTLGNKTSEAFKSLEQKISDDFRFLIVQEYLNKFGIRLSPENIQITINSIRQGSLIIDFDISIVFPPETIQQIKTVTTTTSTVTTTLNTENPNETVPAPEIDFLAILNEFDIEKVLKINDQIITEVVPKQNEIFLEATVIEEPKIEKICKCIDTSCKPDSSLCEPCPIGYIQTADSSATERKCVRNTTPSGSGMSELTTLETHFGTSDGVEVHQTTQDPEFIEVTTHSAFTTMLETTLEFDSVITDTVTLYDEIGTESGSGSGFGTTKTTMTTSEEELIDHSVDQNFGTTSATEITISSSGDSQKEVSTTAPLTEVITTTDFVMTTNGFKTVPELDITTNVDVSFTTEAFNSTIFPTVSSNYQTNSLVVSNSVSIRIEKQFNDDYYDPRSDAYLTLAEQVRQALMQKIIDAYSDRGIVLTEDDIDIKILGFEEGSVFINSEIKLTLDKVIQKRNLIASQESIDFAIEESKEIIENFLQPDEMLIEHKIIGADQISTTVVSTPVLSTEANIIPSAETTTLPTTTTLEEETSLEVTTVDVTTTDTTELSTIKPDTTSVTLTESTTSHHAEEATTEPIALESTTSPLKLTTVIPTETTTVISDLSTIIIESTSTSNTKQTTTEPTNIQPNLGSCSKTTCPENSVCKDVPLISSHECYCNENYKPITSGQTLTSCQLAYKVHCGPEQMVFKIDKTYYDSNNLNQADFKFADNECFIPFGVFNANDNTMDFNFELNENCGTKSSQNSTTWTYSNILSYESQKNGPNRKIQFKCSYPTVGEVGYDHPVNMMLVLDIPGVGNFSLKLNSYNNENFTEADSGPRYIDQNDPVYFAVMTNSTDPSRWLFAEQCFLTNELYNYRTPNPLYSNTLEFVNIIENGCALDPELTRIIDAGDKNSVKFETQVFRIAQTFSQTYINCKVRFCNETNCNHLIDDSCTVQGAHRKRRRRSLTQSDIRVLPNADINDAFFVHSMAIYNNNKKRNLPFGSKDIGLGSGERSPYLWITIGLIVVLVFVSMSYVLSGRLIYRANAYDEGLKSENQIKLKKFKGFVKEDSDCKESSEPPSYPSSSPVNYENENFEFDDNFFTFEDEDDTPKVRVRHHSRKHDRVDSDVIDMKFGENNSTSGKKKYKRPVESYSRREKFV